jgi:hypothetical protein
MTENVNHQFAIRFQPGGYAMKQFLVTANVLDIKQYNGLQLVGFALVIMAITSAYWVTKRTHARKTETKTPTLKEN